MASRLDDFVALSAALTGYTSAELHATGMAGTYLAHVTAIVGEAFAARVWEVGHDVVHRAGHELDTEIGLRLLDDPDFGPVARNLIMLWYTGQWVQLPRDWRQRHGANPNDVDAILSPDSYTEGLVWNAIDAHPQGAKPPGFANVGVCANQESGVTPQSCDVVIVGAGIAGAILARRLAEAGHDVVVLEAGEAVGLTWDDYQANIRQFLAAPAKVPNAAWPNSPAAPSPNVLDIGAVPPDAPPGTAGYFVQMGPIPFGSDYQRSRGGTTLHWYGHSIRMLPPDFEMRSTYGVGVDWPIGYDELSPWYDEAEREIGVAADVEDQQRIGVRFTPGYVYPMFKVPPSYLDRWLGERLDGTPVAIGDGTYLTGVVPVPGGRNSTPNPAYDGGRGYTPVGAVGQPETGLRCEGNASCIPACPAQAKYSALKTLAAAARAGARVIHQTVASRVVLGTGGEVTGIDYLAWTGDTFPRAAQGTITAARYVLAAHSVENAKLLLMSGAANSSDQVGRNLMDHPFLLSWGLADEPLGTFRGPGSTSGIETLRDGPYRSDQAAFRVDIDNWGFGILGAPITDVTNGVFDDGLHGVALRQRLADVVPRQLLLGFLLEQLPDPENRVTIDASKWTDALALPRPILHYDIDAYTHAGAAAARSCAEQWFERVGAEDLTDFGPGHSPVMHQDFEWHGRPYATMGAGHLCGTHRMGDDPATSVVDSEQRSWDHRNLFVVGAGSMPTIGTSNPTLTLAALACRTARAILGDLD